MKYLLSTITLSTQISIKVSKSVIWILGVLFYGVEIGCAVVMAIVVEIQFGDMGQQNWAAIFCQLVRNKENPNQAG
jgi:hypothetical protein